MKWKKAQTATEYLIILAVVIVIALVVVVAMGKFPGIGKGAVGKASQAYWAAQDVAISDFAFADTGDDVIVLKNNMRNTVKVTELLIDGSSIISANYTMGPGGAAKITIASGASEDTECDAGNAYTYSLSVTYEDQATGGTYTFTGDGNNLEGTCAN